jgi:two-component system, LytTR family, response regulator
MKIKAIAIDSTRNDLATIESYTSKIPYVSLHKTFTNPVHALDLINQENVDLIYLETVMPTISGIEFIKGLNKPPKVIFITNHPCNAMLAFEVNALDFLLKPVSFSRFLTATEKIWSQAIIKQRKEDFIFVKSEHHVIKVELNTIQFIEGYKDYLKIHTDHSKPILTITTFKAIEKLLSSNFVRIHKSYIVAIDKIISFRNGRVAVKDKQLPIGDSYKEIFTKAVVSGRST